MEDLHFGTPFPFILMIDSLGAPSDNGLILPRGKILYTYYRLEEKPRPPSLNQTILTRVADRPVPPVPS